MKLLVVEDHPIFRFGVREIVRQRWPEAEVLDAESLAQALTHARARPAPELALVDLNLPDAQGLEALEALQRAAPQMRQLALTFHEESAFAVRALGMGAMGYLNKDLAATELVRALEQIQRGQRYITPSLANHLADLMTSPNKGAPHQLLSAQELRVMLLVAQGERLITIGEQMHLSPKTVSTYRQRVLEKLGLTTNAELTRYCVQHGLEAQPAPPAAVSGNPLKPAGKA